MSEIDDHRKGADMNGSTAMPRNGRLQFILALPRSA